MKKKIGLKFFIVFFFACTVCLVFHPQQIIDEKVRYSLWEFDVNLGYFTDSFIS